MDKKLKYGYDEDFLTHQPRVVYDTVASESYNLYWDANGNLQEVSNCKMDVARFHDWDEENRLRAIVGPKHAGLYGYDSNGNRVWKLTGDCDQTSQNGGLTSYNVYIDDAVLYPNPYITITPQGYTKHYYLGEERIATALGEGGWKMELDIPIMREKELASVYWGAFLQSYPFGEIADPKVDNINETGTYPDVLQYDCPPLQLFRLLPTWNADILLNCITSNINSSGHSELIYYTHNNHLGSASWITDGTGVPVQYIHYAPYGELLANQKASGSTYDERYKFTGKERDAESGYDYYGARYQIVPLGIWGSPDPMLDKTIHMSSYMYCNGNPIVLRDPDGNLGVAAMILVGAGVGAVINGGIALYNGKSMSEVGAAALGGAVSGAIGVVVGEVLIGVGLAATTAGMVGGAVGEGLGDAIEQGVNMIAGNQNSFDLEEMGVSIAAGAVFGKIGAHAQGKVKSVSQKIKTNVNQYYQNSKVIKSTKKEVRKECYLSGNTSKKVINKKTTERLENMKNVDNFIVDCAEETLDKVVIPATNNVLIEKTDDAVR